MNLSLIALLVLITEIVGFIVIDFLFHKKETATKLTDTRLSQKTVRRINLVQLVFILLGALFIFDTWTIITNLNEKKNSIDTSGITGQITRA